MKFVFNPVSGVLDYVASTAADVGITLPLGPASGGTGVANAAGSTLTLGAATSITGGGTLALGGFTLTVAATASISGTNTGDMTTPIAANLGGTGVANLVGSTLTLGGATTISTGGTIALGGFTLTVPATGTAALLATANAFTADQSIAANTALTATVNTNLVLSHNTSGTPATNYGVGTKYKLESSTTADQDAAAINAVWSTATHASRTSQIILQTVTNAAALVGVVTIGGIRGMLANFTSVAASGEGGRFTIGAGGDHANLSGLIGIYSANATTTGTGNTGQAGTRGRVTASLNRTTAEASSLLATVDLPENTPTVTRWNGVNVETPVVASGSIVNAYGLVIKDQNVATTLNYAIFTGAGLVHFGDSIDLASGKNITLLAGNLVTDTTTGSKIGTGSTQKLGFFGQTPATQPAGIANADGTLADITTKFNTMISAMETLGLIATV